ncbi:tRNA (cytosine-5-)-methyltransferase NSUN2, partial [Trifolium medium]|nr:tRNA (cytosine-5-)-methyltransferase NSUN2 [Trifolium medium]
MPGCCVVFLGEGIYHLDAEIICQSISLFTLPQYTHFSTGNKTVAEALQVDESSIAIVCWKGGASLTVMVT